jgi:plasmid maintenance system antidote protein VapI
MGIEETLRKAIERSKQSQTEIANATGIPRPHLCAFINGKRGISMANADKLAAYFGLKLR